MKELDTLDFLLKFGWKWWNVGSC